MSSSFRSLPSVDRVLRELRRSSDLPDRVITQEIRSVIAESRKALSSGAVTDFESIIAEVNARLDRLIRPSLRPVINATGVILHTNLGRAPLASFQPIPRYSNLEYDLQTGKRGKRDAHTAHLLHALLGSPAIVVNNNAAAVFLVLHELASGTEVIVSRGELIEIGDGFRIPEIMARSGAGLREVGTTNRTTLEDYRAAINERTRLILRVHPSNFQISGFTFRPELSDLCALGRQYGVPIYEDLGSGCLVDLKIAGVTEPLVTDSLQAGVNILSFSCDKLLGGPQSGIISGDPELIARVRKNPMYRAFRVDKLVIESLGTTLRELLRENWEALPAIHMILAHQAILQARARRIAARLADLDVTVRESVSPIGGGSTPDQTLPTWLVTVAVENPNSFERVLREARTPVIARIQNDCIVFDMRTVDDSEEDLLVAAARSARESTIETPHNRAVDNRG